MTRKFLQTQEELSKVTEIQFFIEIQILHEFRKCLRAPNSTMSVLHTMSEQKNERTPSLATWVHLLVHNRLIETDL